MTASAVGYEQVREWVKALLGVRMPRSDKPSPGRSSACWWPSGSRPRRWRVRCPQSRLGVPGRG